VCPRTVTDLPGGDASFIFTETCSGEVDGKKGSFISQGKGTFDSKTYVAAGEFTVVEGSGSERAIFVSVLLTALSQRATWKA
jgi:hypothetical protein